MDVTQASVADTCHRPGRSPQKGTRPGVRTAPGHSRASVTLDVYAHLLARLDGDVGERTERALGQTERHG
jgi:hypothetical protein